MIRHTSLWEVVGTDLLRTVSGTDLAAAHLCFRIVSLLLLDVIQLGFQQCECLRLVLDLGLLGMIGKGRRSSAVKEAVVRNGAVYFAAVGGAGALLSKSIREAEIVAYEDLGTEAIRKLTVEEFPVIVCMDSEGTDLYETAAEKYREEFV